MEPVSIADGKVLVPERSGLGVDIDKTILKKYMIEFKILQTEADMLLLE